MTSPNERRPGGTEAATSFAGDTESVPRCDSVSQPVAARRHRPHGPRMACPHLRVRYCRKCRYVGRRVSAELTALCRADAAAGRSDYGLDPESVRAEANRLWSLGWSVAEVAAVLPVVAK